MFNAGQVTFEVYVLYNIMQAGRQNHQKCEHSLCHSVQHGDIANDRGERALLDQDGSENSSIQCHANVVPHSYKRNHILTRRHISLLCSQKYPEVLTVPDFPDS